MADLSARISLLATRVANYIRDSVLPRLVPAGGTNGQFLKKTADTDFALGWGSPASSGNIESCQSILSGDVTLTTTGTYYDGPSITLGVGTWLVNAQVLCSHAAVATFFYSNVTDGSVYYACAANGIAANSYACANMAMSFIITITGSSKTLKIQATSNSGSGTTLMKSSLLNYIAGSRGTQINAIRLSS